MNRTHPKTQIQPLLAYKQRQSEQTRLTLHLALDRFERGQCKVLAPGTKLTVRSLASEARVSKDTILARISAGRPQGGAYRFPDVVSRLKDLQATQQQARARARRQEKQRAVLKEKEEDNEKLRRLTVELDLALFAARRDIERLKAENARLAAENASLIAKRGGQVAVLGGGKRSQERAPHRVNRRGTP